MLLRLAWPEIRIVVARIDATLAVPVAILAAARGASGHDGNHGRCLAGHSEVHVDIDISIRNYHIGSVAPPVAPPTCLNDKTGATTAEDTAGKVPAPASWDVMLRPRPAPMKTATRVRP